MKTRQGACAGVQRPSDRQGGSMWVILKILPVDILGDDCEKT